MVIRALDGLLGLVRLGEPTESTMVVAIVVRSRDSSSEVEGVGTCLGESSVFCDNLYSILSGQRNFSHEVGT